MLSIRQAQMEALHKASRKQFLKRLVARCRESWPQATEELGTPGTEEFVNRAVETAERHGVRSQRDAARFVDLTFAWGEGFDETQVWAVQILADKTLRGGVKVHQLVHKSRRELQRLADERREA